jgi:hypothetical protein
VRAENARDGDADDEEDDEVEDNSRKQTRAERAVAKTQREMLERLNALPGAVAGLSHVCPALGALFDSKFGEASVMQGKGAPDVYRRFFFQVSLLSASHIVTMTNSQMLRSRLKSQYSRWRTNPR